MTDTWTTNKSTVQKQNRKKCRIALLLKIPFSSSPFDPFNSPSQIKNAVFLLSQ
jgi:hypothetical protein